MLRMFQRRDHLALLIIFRDHFLQTVEAIPEIVNQCFQCVVVRDYLSLLPVSVSVVNKPETVLTSGWTVGTGSGGLYRPPPGTGCRNWSATGSEPVLGGSRNR